MANSASDPRQLPALTETTTSSPAIRFEYGKSGLTIAGDTSSAAHEVILRQVAAEFFPQAPLHIELAQRAVLLPGWALLTELTLRAVANTYSSTATINDSRVIVRGFTMRKTSWDSALARLRKNLPEGMTLQHEVVELQPGASLQNQCSALFHSALRGRKVGFAVDSDQLNPSSYSILDELIQIVADCPTAAVSVTGHSDNNGKEAGNLKLSKARAKSVVAYMVNGGITAKRVRAIGAGSSTPLLAENNARARRMNRRIEFGIEFPLGFHY
jgi:outer membrane protein OmpA-like peptidoglycan-associated protein